MTLHTSSIFNANRAGCGGQTSWSLFNPKLSMQSHVKSTIISILNQRLYLLNQLRKQGLNVSGLLKYL